MAEDILQALQVNFQVRFSDAEDDIFIFCLRAVHVVHELVNVNLIVLVGVDLREDRIDVIVCHVFYSDSFQQASQTALGKLAAVLDKLLNVIVVKCLTLLKGYLTEEFPDVFELAFNFKQLFLLHVKQTASELVLRDSAIGVAIHLGDHRVDLTEASTCWLHDLQDLLGIKAPVLV